MHAFHYLLELLNKPLCDTLNYPIYLYHKGNMEGIKSDMLDLQLNYFMSDPYLNYVESNWNNFKQAINNTIITHIPLKPSQSRNNLQWISYPFYKEINELSNLFISQS